MFQCMLYILTNASPLMFSVTQHVYNHSVQINYLPGRMARVIEPWFYPLLSLITSCNSLENKLDSIRTFKIKQGARMHTETILSAENHYKLHKWHAAFAFLRGPCSYLQKLKACRSKGGFIITSTAFSWSRWIIHRQYHKPDRDARFFFK